MADYRFTRSPRWIATHVLIVGIAVLFVSLGLWQLRRLDERRDRNALIEARRQLAPAPVQELGPDADAWRYLPVTAAGMMAGLATVRTNQAGAPGFHAVSLVLLADGRAVAVLRGFAGTEPDGSPPTVEVPHGGVEVTGLAIELDRTTNAIRHEVGELVDDAGDPELLPMLVQAESDPDPDLTPVPPPELGEGPHLSYAVQWFLFTGVVVVGYPFLLRRRAGRDADA